MVSTNHTILEALSRYLTLMIEDKTFIFIAIATLIYSALIIVNLKSKNSLVLFLTFNVLFLIIIMYTNGSNILKSFDTFFKPNFYKNMFFYYFNTMISILLYIYIYYSKKINIKYKYGLFTLYFFIVLNMIFMISRAHFYKDMYLIILFNTYPMVYVGNILSILLYGLIIGYFIYKVVKEKILTKNLK